MNEQLYQDTDIRVIDQRIGVGIGGLNTVIRLYHKPTGILIEMPLHHPSTFSLPDKLHSFYHLHTKVAKINPPLDGTPQGCIRVDDESYSYLEAQEESHVCHENEDG